MIRVKLLHCDGCRKPRVIWKNYTNENSERERYCKCCWSAHESEKEAKKPTTRKPLRSRSRKRQKLDQEYSTLRKDFLENRPYCEMNIPGICLHHATDVHHKKGRGKYYLVVETWIPGCRPCHSWVEVHPKEAREMGLSDSKLT